MTEICNESAQIRISEIGGLDALGLRDTKSLLPGLSRFTIQRSNDPSAIKNNVKESMKYTLWKIYQEVVIAYAMKLDRIAALGCRGVAERALRICFQETSGKPANDRLPLGPLIKDCKKIGLSLEILDLAEEIKKEGDNLAHAKYEQLQHWNGIQMHVSPKNSGSAPVAHYHTGDAKACLVHTRDLLFLIFSASGCLSD